MRLLKFICAGTFVVLLAASQTLAASASPAVAITSPATGTSTAVATITVQGTSSSASSSIISVKVSNVAATTSNSYATWSATVPLGYGTNRIAATATDAAGNYTVSTSILVTLTTAQTYNPLIVPDTISGTTFNLSINATTKQFFSGAITNTYAYNDYPFGAPTLIFNKGDSIQMHVTNNLSVDTTTTHWHGFHFQAIMDGGPHQTIPAGTTWSPYWPVINNAGTFWYHPHLHQKTQQQISLGAVGMIIVRDPQEAALALPRTYGVDDFPLAMTSRKFANNQIDTTIPFGDNMLVNGTLNPQVTLPKQYVRLRLLNSEIERSYNLGFSDNRTFYVIATDGGLVAAPIAVTRLLMAVGERYEILMDLTGDTVGASLDLKAYNSTASLGTTIAPGFPGSQPGGPLNNADFNILHINIGATTTGAITTRPTSLVTYTPWTNADVTNSRTVTITGGGGGLAFDNLVYSPTVINQTINLNAIEKWTVTNNTNIAHAFHIHDIQFTLISRTVTGQGITGIFPFEQGWKDTLFIQGNSTVTFITKFDLFASNTNPFMYHCHFATHEDAGLMAQFLVVSATPNTIADLFNLTPSVGTLSPSFSYATLGYTDSVTNATSSITLTPTVTDAGATVKVNGVTVASGSASTIVLNVGANVITTVVTAADGVTTKTYTVTVTRAGTTNSDLVSLAPSAGSLSPTFTSATLGYTDNVTNATSTITLTPTLSDLSATVKVNGASVTSGSASSAISLNVGSNVINTLVTASDGATTKTYVVTVTRAAASNADLVSLTPSAGSLTPSFVSGTLSYSDSVLNATTSVALTPTLSDTNATVKVNGTTVTSGAASGAISLNVGANVINTIVTAADGVTTKTYVVTVNRAASSNADLISLTPSAGSLTPSFVSGTLSYSDSVSNATTSITLTPTVSDGTATIKVNGTIVASGSASGAISLNVGANTINTVVTAGDGVTTKTYGVTVNRAVSSNADLISLTPSVGSLSPSFSSATLSYADSVSSATASITLTPTVSDAGATVKVNGTSVASGSPSGSISLSVGPNVINTVVTAADGVTTKTYAVTINRSASNNAGLVSLTPSAGTLSPAFSAGTLSYADSVAFSSAGITLTPVTSDAGATVTINGIAVASGSVSGAISLNVGLNVINIVVTAADGVTTVTYAVTVSRAPMPSADLVSLTPNAGTLSPVFVSATTSYLLNVPSGTASVTLTPVTADAGATVKINGAAVSSGTASGALRLNSGANSINVVVTATDGTTTKTYALSVQQAPAITSVLSVSGEAGQPFTYTILATGYPAPKFTATPLPDGLQLVGGTISGTPTTPGTTQVALGASNGVPPDDAKTLVVTIAPPKPVFSSAPTAAPNPATVSLSVQFTALASNPLPLAYTWDFGDGTQSSGASTTHIFAHTGTFMVTVTATSSAGASASQSLALTVNPLVGGTPGAGSGTLAGELDSDGDGYSDKVEIAAGTDPYDANSMPGGMASAPPAVPISKPIVKISAKKRLQMTGTIEIIAGFSPQGKNLVVDIGGYTQHFTLDAKGNGVTGADKWTAPVKVVRGTVRAQKVRFTLLLNSVPDDVQSTSPLILVLDGAVFSK